MLTKNDRKQLIADFKEVFATKDDLKNFTTKGDLKTIKDDLKIIKNDLTVVKNEVTDIKSKVNNFYSFTLTAFGHLFDWTNDVNQTLNIKQTKRSKRSSSVSS
ncbi:TPA: hypothetical protein DIV55_00155 [Patescibacteria group bacterium]|uniref:Uncharacterized protein n=1 Tax=Candidatus Gottesmanbacteria bacterium GW2011_GWA1_43_11 TaxID=1618436 RepID=A0A0G1FGT7_9BACT|nr:MAG: hypothetical protein UV59_C0003G0058 [Candidatus Gottesmanbacteria bacterium GW2011_GWA1_43_11]HCS78139.1 hypothetical protein [Patescibacteria group bacterium]